MPAKIELTSATLSAVPDVNQGATVKYKLTSQPDSYYITYTTNAPILPNGNFSPFVVILGLLTGTSYTVRVINNCDEDDITNKVFVTPLLSCVNIIDIIGTTSEE